MPGDEPRQDLLAHAAIGVAVLDRDGGILEANAHLCRVTGRSVEELLRIGCAGIAHPEDWGWQRALVAEVANGKHRELDLDLRCLRPDGTCGFLSVALSPLSEGRVVGIVQDVTARRLGEDALRRNELHFRRTIEKLPAAAYTCDAEGLITFFNEQAARLWGRAPRLHDPRDRWCGSFKLFTPDGAPLDHAHCWMARALREGRDYDGVEIVIERPDGSRAAALAHAKPIRDERGEIVACMNILVDITDRKRAEQRLHDSELRFKQFMEHLPGLAWIKDREGRYLFVNEAAAQAFQRPRDELYGRSDDEIFPERTSAEFRENDQKALRSGTGIETVETLEQADGLHHSLVSKFPIPGPDGSPSLVGGVAIDISARIRAEERLKEADRRKNEFLATLAHELRNPLAPIRSSLELLRRSDGSRSEIVQMLERQVDQMVRLVDDLLDVARITRGHLELRRERVALADVVRAAIETARPIITSSRHELTLSLPTQPLWLDADPLRLSQVLVNLLNNAARYTQEGGRIELSAETAGGAVTLTVRDNGIGIERSVLSRIFDPFTQVKQASDRRGGLGIGLALVAQLAALHGGRAEAHSEGAGKGSEFRVTLPLAGAPEQSATLLHSVRPAGRSALRGPVLVVDDNHDAAESLALLLRSRGLRAEVAFDGAAALELAPRLQPALVLLDLGLPEMDGFEVARRLRAEPTCRHAQLVALTGWNQPSVREQCARAGFDHHVVKPVALEALEQLLALPPGAAAS